MQVRQVADGDRRVGQQGRGEEQVGPGSRADLAAAVATGIAALAGAALIALAVRRHAAPVALACTPSEMWASTLPWIAFSDSEPATDTSGWSRPPFEGTLDNGRLHGWGVADDEADEQHRDPEGAEEGQDHARDQHERCHQRAQHAENEKDPLTCMACHKEHRDQKKIAEVADATCASCHANLAPHVKVALAESVNCSWMPRTE